MRKEEKAGFEAFHAGVAVGDNPYDEDTEEHWLWMRGWSKAGIQSRRREISGLTDKPADTVV